jgi:ABC-type lipoprotein export system ATPase subunit
MANSVVFQWQNIRYSIQSKDGKENKEILKGLNGNVHPGQLCAILGPSGSGKVNLNQTNMHNF